MKKTAVIAFSMLVILAVSWPARGYWIARANFGLDPAVSPEQFRPAADGSRPAPGNPPLPVKMELMSMPPLMPEGAEEAVERGVLRWGRIEGSALKISFISPAGRAEDDGSWVDRLAFADGRNTIDFVVKDWPAYWGPAKIGITIPKLGADGRILEADVFFNARDYDWVVFAREGFYPDLAALKYVDVEALATHEMGHVLGLGHSQYTWASMYAYLGYADTRARRLSGDDREGIRNLYPLTEADRGAPSLWGVHEDNFGDAVCGMSSSASTFTSAVIVYIDLTSASLTLNSPPLAGDTLVKYCLFGSGFGRAPLTGMSMVMDGAVLQDALSPAYVAPTFVKAVIGNGAAPTAALPAGTYDLCERESGTSGCLRQGLFVTPPGNSPPEAAASVKPRTSPGSCVTLDGSASFDPESSPLSFRWSAVDVPPGARVKWSGEDTVRARACLSGPGIYVFELVVNDGTMDSAGDLVSVQALPGLDDGGGEGGALSCSAAEGGRAAGLVWLLAPVIGIFLARLGAGLRMRAWH